MKLSEFKIKPVRGLYTYYHFERPDGAFVQISYRGDNVVFQDTNGARRHFNSIEHLKAEMAS